MEIQFDRLTRMANMLDREAKNPHQDFSFDLGSNGWGQESSCGTVACAIGLAVFLGEFKADGFTNNSLWGLCPEYGDYSTWDAVIKFFGLEKEIAYSFFHQDYFPLRLRSGPKSAVEVSRRIRAFIAEKQPQIKTETKVLETV